MRVTKYIRLLVRYVAYTIELSKKAPLDLILLVLLLKCLFLSRLMPKAFGN